MLGKMLIQGLVAAILIGSAAAVYAQTEGAGLMARHSAEAGRDGKGHKFKSHDKHERQGRKRGHDGHDD